MSVNIYGPINDLGYGIVTRGLIKGLQSLGINDFHLDCIGPPQIEDQQELQKLMYHMNELYWKRSLPSVALWHEFDLSKFSGKKLIAMPFFETTDFFPIAKSYLSQMDSIFVLSNWAKTVIHNSIGTSVPVQVIPAAANLLETPEILNTQKSPIFTFIAVGKFEKRKSHLEVMQAYLNAFSNYPAETRLILHCYNPFDANFAKNMSGYYQRLGLQIINSMSRGSTLVGVRGKAVIEVPLGRIDANQLNKLYRYAHVGVYPSKAEGWNLPLMESIQSNLPCIATNYSAHTEYLTPEFKYPQDLLLKNIGTEVALDGVFFHGNRGNWCTINVNELSEKMLYAYNNYANIIKNFDNQLIKSTFTWQNMATKFMGALSTLD